MTSTEAHVSAIGSLDETIRVGFLDPEGNQILVECVFNEVGMLRISSKDGCIQ